MTAERESMTLQEMGAPALGVEERRDEAPQGRSQPRAANAGPGGRGQAEEAQVHRAVSTAGFWRRQRAARSPARWAGCFAARVCTAPI